MRTDEGDLDSLDSLPPCHWKPQVALDPKHRPQRWDRPSSTVRRDWRKFPQEAHILDQTERKYRRFSSEEVALLQGFDPSIVRVDGLTERQRIAALGDAVPPPLGRAVLGAIDSQFILNKRTTIEICAGTGGLAEGAAAAGLEHLLLVDHDPVCGQLLSNNRPWSPNVVRVADARELDYREYRGRLGLLSGGPPCQPWSQSGRREGPADPRDLLGQLPELVGRLRPEVFVFENVPGLASGENAPYLEDLVTRFRTASNEASYGVMVGLFNSADFGVPQIRRRLFIIGFLGRPASDVSRCFDEVARRATHQDPKAQRSEEKRPWLTIGEALEGQPDPGGWRRWIAG